MLWTRIEFMLARRSEMGVFRRALRVVALLHRQPALRRAIALAVAIGLLAPLAPSPLYPAPARAQFGAPTPPKRIVVPEPVRKRTADALPPAAVRMQPGVPARPAYGRAVQPPPAPRPGHPMSAVPVQRPALRVITLPTTTTGVRNAPSSGTRAALPTGGLRIGGGVVRPQSLALGGSQAGTGINPWWRYAEENIPGKQHMMVNVGTGNVIIDADDMSIPHKGISLAFRRTYNSQSMHDVNGTDGTVPSMYGNGWTNTFDAHVSGAPTGSAMIVWDIDGAAYVYAPSGAPPPSKPVMSWTPPAGKQGTTLVSDGACTFFWTKKGGTVYQFYRPDLGSAAALSTGCSSTQSAYAGRLVAIFGRNHNTSLTLTYSWDNGNAGAGAKVSQIVVSAESGLHTTLTFADFGSYRELSTLTWPDGTIVSYNYDSYGDLITAKLPANNSSHTLSIETYSYQTAPNGFHYLYTLAPP